MQIMIIMRLALLDAGRAVLKRSRRFEGGVLSDRDRARRRRVDIFVFYGWFLKKPVG